MADDIDPTPTPAPTSGGRSRLFITLVASVGIVVGAALLVGLIWATEPEAQREGAVKRSAMLVELTSPEAGTFRPELIAMGTVRAVQDVVLQPRVSGQIRAVSPDFVPGRVVPAGHALVTIDPSDLKNQLAQERSALQQAQAELAMERGRQAVAQTERAQIEGEVTPEQEALITRQPQLQAAEAAVEAAQARVRQAELDVARTQVAPAFDALVLERAVSEGSQVTTNDVLGRVVGVETYWVELTLPTRRLRHLADIDGASTVLLRDRAAWPEGVYRAGRVESVVQQVDAQTRLARVLVAIDDPLALDPATEGPALTAGAWVEARLQAAPLADVVRLDRALLRKGDTVWEMDDQDQLRIHPVEVLLEDDRYVYLGAGLSPDARVVATDLSTVTEGAPLRLADADGEAAQAPTPEQP